MGKERKRASNGATTAKPVTPRRKTPAPKSIWNLMKKPIKHLNEHSQKSGQNSDYKGRPIELKDVHIWKDFITVHDVEALWENNDDIKPHFLKNMKTEDSDRCLWGEPVAGGMYNEMCLERQWSSIHNQFNLAFELCAKAEQKTDKPIYVQMGDGQNAEWISSNAEVHAKRKRPDYASYLYSDSAQFEGESPKHVFNRIPGDAKQFRKMSRAMLPPNGSKYRPTNVNREARKVLSQIHGYMDQHEARYGYIVNNEELIFFRRRDTGWGQLDISEAIRHDVEADAATGVLNSKYVLFYFHWKIARDDSDNGWRLGSFGKSPATTTTGNGTVLTRHPNSAKKTAQVERNSIMASRWVHRWVMQKITASWKQAASLWVSRFVDIPAD